MIASNNNVDRALADSFPASDPPPWVFGGAKPVSPAPTPTVDRAGDQPVDRTADRPIVSPDVVWLSDRQSSSWTAAVGGHVRAVVMACAVVLLTPIFVVALPFALAARALLSLGGWRFSLSK
jgi:hypothetical protein